MAAGGEVGFGEDVLLPTNQSADFSPGAISSGAESYSDVLKFGLSRLIDAKTRPVSPENTKPELQAATSAPVQGAGTINPRTQQMLFAVGLVVVGAFVVVALRRRGS